jgi:hypothetical protein
VLVTKVFDKLSAVVAESAGYGDLARYILPHPLNPLPEEQVRQILQENLTGIVAKLLKAE